MKRKLPPLNPLRAFEVAARHSSFTLAAEELNLTQSAISKQVNALEEYLQVPLFRRDNRRLELTESGKQYLPALTQAFDSIDYATARLFDVKDKNRLFVKSTLRTFSMSWLVPRLPSFQSQYPNLEVHLNTAMHLSGEDFFREPIDVAISREHTEIEGVCQEEFMKEVLIPVCRPGKLNDSIEIKSPADLKHCTLLHNGSRPDCWNIWLQESGIEGVEPDAGVTLDGFFLIIQAAIAGMGVAIMPAPIAAEALKFGHLVKPFDIPIPSGESYFLLYLEHRADLPKIKSFRDWLFAKTGES